jgi:hypothetical protein
MGPSDKSVRFTARLSLKTRYIPYSEIYLIGSESMIRGISDLDYSEAKRLLTAIIESTIEEDKALRREREEKKIEILQYEYYKRLSPDNHMQQDKAIEACNRRIEEIGDEIYTLKEKKDYFVVQLEMVCGKETA